MSDINNIQINTDLIDADFIHASNNNNKSYKRSIYNFILGGFLKTKVYHIIWHIFHSFSVIYPEEPTEEERLITKNFINQITTNLSLICASCGSKNKDTFIANYDIDLAVHSRINLIQFFCDYHKKVNMEYRNNEYINYEPEIYTIQFIINRYTQNNYISYIETLYDVNLFLLFQQKSMDDFFQIFNINMRKVYKETNQYDLNIIFSKQI